MSCYFTSTFLAVQSRKILVGEGVFIVQKVTDAQIMGVVIIATAEKKRLFYASNLVKCCML